jgi:hypothetical protein
MLGSRDARMTRMRWAFIVLAVAAPARAQVNPARADISFKEAAELCAKDGGRLWGQSLCRPIVVADATTRTVATSQPAPDAPRPPALGFAIPNGRSNSFATAGRTPIPGVGTIVPGFRTTGEWGTLEAATVLLSANRTTLTVPASGSIDGTTLRGDGWTLTLAAGWVLWPGARAGDFQVVRE